MASKTNDSTSRGRPENPDARRERRNRILRGARTCFIDRGFDAASISEIASEAGVSVANIYQYFENKEGLVHALIAQNLELDLQKIDLMNSTDFDEGKLRGFMQAAFADRNYVDGVRLSQEVVAEGTRSPEVAALINTAETKALAALALGLETAMADGTVQGQMEANQAATMISYFHDGLVTRLALQPELAPELADQFTDFIVEVVNRKIE